MTIESTPGEYDDGLTPRFSHADEMRHESQIPPTLEELVEEANQAATSLIQLQETLETLPSDAIIAAAKERIISSYMSGKRLDGWREISLLFSYLSPEEITQVRLEVDVAMIEWLDDES